MTRAKKEAAKKAFAAAIKHGQSQVKHFKTYHGTISYIPNNFPQMDVPPKVPPLVELAQSFEYKPISFHDAIEPIFKGYPECCVDPTPRFKRAGWTW